MDSSIDCPGDRNGCTIEPKCTRCLVCVGPASAERRGGREVGASDPGARAGGG